MEMEPDSGPEAQLKFEAHQADLEKRFETFGEEVSWDKVPELVRAGREVYSFGYGSDEQHDFVTISESDLDIFEWGEAYILDWAPFRVAPLPSLSNADSDAAGNMIAELEVMGYIVLAVEPNEPYCQSQFARHWIKNHEGPEDPVCGACGGDFLINS